MFVKEWSEKLTNHTKQQFMNSSFWIDAASHGLSWEEAVIDMPTVKAAVNRMDKASAAVLRAFYSCFGAGPVHEERLFSSGALHMLACGGLPRWCRRGDLDVFWCQRDV